MYYLIEPEWKLRPDVEIESQVDTADMFDSTPRAIGPQQPKHPKPEKRDNLATYRAKVGCMDMTELVGERLKHQRTLEKYQGAHWLDKVRQKLDIIEQAITASKAAQADLALAEPDDQVEITVARDSAFEQGHTRKREKPTKSQVMDLFSSPHPRAMHRRVQFMELLGWPTETLTLEQLEQRANTVSDAVQAMENTNSNTACERGESRTQQMPANKAAAVQTQRLDRSDGLTAQATSSRRHRFSSA